MRLRTRLFALVGGVVAAAVALTTLTISSAARRSFELLDRQRTEALLAQFRREFAARGDDVARRIDRLASADVVQRMALDLSRRGADRALFVGEAAPIAAVQGLDFLDLVASDGTIVSSAQWPARFGYRHPWATTASPRMTRSQPGGRSESSRANAFLQAIDLPRETALGLVAVRAVGETNTLYVAGGLRIDHQFLKALALPDGMRALLYRNIEPEVSRQQLIDSQGNVPQAAPLEPLIARVRQTGRENSETVQWPDGPESVIGIPLTGADGRVLGVLLVGSSGRELAALLGRIRWSGIGFGLFGVSSGLFLSYLVSRAVTRPVEQVADAARRVAAGEWDVHVDAIGGAAEVGELARAFDTMTTQLVDQRDRLVQAERVAAWRELARRLAHELKNPLFPLRITIDNLRRARSLPAPEFDEVFEESLSTLGTGLMNLNLVVGRFGDFAKMPAPSFETVAPNDIVAQAVRLFRAQAEAPGRPPIELSVDLDARCGSLRADGDQLGRVVQNLLLNAIDAMPNGGALRVRTQMSGSTFRLDIADTGQGLTDEERERLFTPYYTTKQHGTGLGLAIVQSVVADHAGRVWVDGTPGGGATFHIELPA